MDFNAKEFTINTQKEMQELRSLRKEDNTAGG